MNTSDFGANILDDGASPTRPAPGDSDSAEAPTKKRAPRKKKVRATAPSSPATAAPPTPDVTADPVAEPDAAAVGDSSSGDSAEAAPGKKRRRRKRRDEPAVGQGVGQRGEQGEQREDDPPETDRDRDEHPAPRDFADRGDDELPPFEADAAESDDDPAQAGTDERPGSLEREGRRRRRRRRGRRTDDDREPGPGAGPHQPESRREPDFRRGQGREPRREAEPSREREPARGRISPRPDRTPTRGPVEVPTPDGETRGARIAILIDLDHVERRAQALGSEIAWGRLVTGLGRRRHVVRSIAYATDGLAAERRSTLVGNGIDVHAVADARTLPVAVAVDAMNLASRVDCVVLVPPSDDLEPVARALRGHGIRLESADFIEALESAESLCESHHQLGDECLFEP